MLELAAAYAIGIAKNHPFVDGNKRTAFVACVLFLEENGFRFGAEPSVAESVFVRVAAGAIGEVELAQWLETVCTQP